MSTIQQHDEKMACKILRFWHLLTMIQQDDFPNSRDYKDTRDIKGRYKDAWADSTVADTIQYAYKPYGATVYLGKLQREDAVDSIAHSCSLDVDRPEAAVGRVACASFQVDSEGRYEDGTFSLSPVLWAVNELRANDPDWEWPLVFSWYISKQKELEKILQRGRWGNSDNRQPVDQHTISKLWSIICAMMPPRAERADDEAREVSAVISDLRNRSFAAQLAKNQYADDLKMVLDAVETCPADLPKHLIPYIVGPYEESRSILRTARHDVICAVQGKEAEFVATLERCLAPGYAPLGKWPSRFSPALMQQAAVNCTNAENGMRQGETLPDFFSVNGPPGTGKTTLLKEVVAGQIVRRAMIMAEQDDPDAFFRRRPFAKGTAAARPGKSGEVYGDTQPHDSRIPYWYALMDLRLAGTGTLVASSNNGAVENITKDLPLIANLMPASTDSRAKQEVFGLFDPVRTAGHITLGQKNGSRNGQKAVTRDVYLSAFASSLLREKPTDRWTADPKVGQETEYTAWGLIAAALGNTANITNFRNSVLTPLLKSSFFWAPGTRTEGRSIRKERYREAADGFRKQLRVVQEMRSRIMEDASLRRGERAMDAPFYADLWSGDPERTARAQQFNPWMSEAYDIEREKLFWHALQVNREFVAASRAMWANLKTLSMYWAGGRVQLEPAGVMHELGPALFQTLMLLVPVVSTTFASVQRMLKDVRKPGSLGLLIVDEAGQAEPQAALGTLFRCQRALIVGDPKQIEPVVTGELDALKHAFRDPIYKPYQQSSISVQSCADILNPYGTELGSDEDRQWVGSPLVVHRRCDEPMFSIANELSYGGIMVRAPKGNTNDPTFLHERSGWIDIGGPESSTEKNHYVAEQGSVVVRMLLESRERTGNQEPDIFVISPFSSVVQGIRRAVGNEFPFHWINTHVGTVHTFQGKEAAEVIFVLGCDDQAMGAVSWVNANVVNVAATRAKHRLYVVGDRALWLSNPNMRIAAAYLDPLQTAAVPVGGDALGVLSSTNKNQPSEASDTADADDRQRNTQDNPETAEPQDMYQFDGQTRCSDGSVIVARFAPYDPALMQDPWIRPLYDNGRAMWECNPGSLESDGEWIVLKADPTRLETGAAYMYGQAPQKGVRDRSAHDRHVKETVAWDGENFTLDDVSDANAPDEKGW